MLFLKPNDIAELTGRKRSALQVRWLAENGFRFVIGADGRPKVLIGEVDFHLNHAKTERPQPMTQPDFSKV